MLHQIHTIKDNPLHGLKAVDVRGTNAQRYRYRFNNPYDIIQAEFVKADCFSCGKCCKKIDAGRVKIFPNEPNRQRLIEHLAKKGKSLNIVQDGYERMTFENSGCIFLSETNSCAIYGDKPQICSEYPFGLVNNQNILAIISNCPPISRLRETGILSIYASDVIISIKKVLSNPALYSPAGKEAEFKETISQLYSSGNRFYLTPLLGPALLNVITNYRNSQEPYNRLQHSPFTSLNGNIFFIIV